MFILSDILESGGYPNIVRSSRIITDIFTRYRWDVDLTDEIKMDIADFTFFNSTVVYGFRNMGIEVVLPDELTVTKSAKLSLVSDENISSKTSLTLDDLNRFDWKVAIGDESFSLSEFEDLSQNYNGLVKLNNKYVRINPDDLRAID